MFDIIYPEDVHGQTWLVVSTVVPVGQVATQTKGYFDIISVVEGHEQFVSEPLTTITASFGQLLTQTSGYYA